MIETFDKDNFHSLCDIAATKDPCLQFILSIYGYPPLWSRDASFETLVHIILEQQVSLASAKAALNKLKELVGKLAPESILLLTDEQLRGCYFSRQKMGYVRHLAANMVEVGETGISPLDLASLHLLGDDEIRAKLTSIKGIGNWSAEVYLMMVLHRTDLFPVSDIALVNSVRHEMQLPSMLKDEIRKLAEKWKPLRTIAAFMFWHAYIIRKGIRV